MQSIPVRSSFTDSLLAALQYQGTSNDCGPFTTATVINALYGLDLQAVDLARQMNRPVWRGLLPVVRRIPNWATFPWGMVDVFKSFDLRASWRPLVNPISLYEGLGQDRVLMPVVASWKPLWAHVMTLVAWDPGKGWGFANTQYHRREIHWLPDKLFKHQWKRSGRLLIEVRHG